MFNLLDQAMSSRERIPDVICAGHVHDYQRFALDASKWVVRAPSPTSRRDPRGITTFTASPPT